MGNHLVDAWESMTAASGEAEILKRRRAAFDLAIDHHYFFLDNGKLRATQDFLDYFRRNWRLDSPMLNEEILYRVMAMIRELSPDLNEPGFFSVRRVVWKFAWGEHEGWWQSHPRTPRPLAKSLEELTRLKTLWNAGLKLDGNKDMLTLTADKQLENANEIIAKGKNFLSELLMWKQRTLAVTMFGPPDPMTQAIAAVKQSKPDGYSFGAEAWKAPIPNDYKKWGDLEKVDSKVEMFMQVCAENDDPYLIRTFAIDREKAILIRDFDAGQSRMPRWWEIDQNQRAAPSQIPYT